MKISLKYLLGGALIGFVLLLAAFSSWPDGKLHLVFCDVGQGDAIYVRTPNGEDILVDGGPNEKVLGCLGKHMPFYDRKIELVFLSHPQADHLNGLNSVLERYNVDYFISSGTEGKGEEYKKLMDLIKNNKIPLKKEAAGEKILLDNLSFLVLWPSTQVLGAQTSQTDLNELSLVLELTYNQFNALLTGDAGQDVQQEIRNQESGISDIKVIKVPHHGSKTSLLSSFLEQIKPKLAIISVGKNSYGHPTKETLGILRDKDIRILRTDEDGEIEIVSDGEKWWRKN
ncbi:MAG: MBL fold metallo-hydrolase [Patescibacteria group bacterium]|nr:MBL fold metallo-hydrolase [Patescibacteria group bacterium]MCL5095263.1 MBL fold metallo-hydrolase [Patescibacteria group bacterium]